jgi:UMF1 family MFS transporter
LAFGFLDEKIGGKKTIMLTLITLMLATAMAVWAPDRTWLWVAGMGIGLIVGPIAAAREAPVG